MAATTGNQQPFLYPHCFSTGRTIGDNVIRLSRDPDGRLVMEVLLDGNVVMGEEDVRWLAGRLAAAADNWPTI